MEETVSIAHDMVLYEKKKNKESGIPIRQITSASL